MNNIIRAIKMFLSYFLPFAFLLFFPVGCGIGITKLCYFMFDGQDYEAIGIVIGFLIFMCLIATGLELSDKEV